MNAISVNVLFIVSICSYFAFALGLHRSSSCSGWSWQHWPTSVLHLSTWINW